MHVILLSLPPAAAWRPEALSRWVGEEVRRQPYRFMFTSSSSMESVTVIMRVLA